MNSLQLGVLLVRKPYHRASLAPRLQSLREALWIFRIAAQHKGSQFLFGGKAEVLRSGSYESFAVLLNEMNVVSISSNEIQQYAWHGGIVSL